MLIGSLKDDIDLNYNETLHLFSTDAGPLTLADVRKLDSAGAIRWRYLEYRDWMRNLDEAAFQRAFEESFDKVSPDSMDPESYVRLHALKDDSYLYGHMVDEGDSTPSDPRAALLKSLAAGGDACGRSAGSEGNAANPGDGAKGSGASSQASSASASAKAPRKDADRDSQEASAPDNPPEKEGEGPPKRIDVSTAQDIARTARELGLPIIFDDVTNLPHPVRLVPRGLGGLLYKILGFEKADKELGYRIIHDVTEMQKPLDYRVEDEESPEDDDSASDARRGDPGDDAAREGAAASSGKPGIRERRTRIRRKADKEQGRGKDTLQPRDQKGLGDPLQDVNADYSSQRNKDELNMFS